MGYTNSYQYWTPSPETTQAVIEDIQLLVANSGTALKVIREPGQIVLNGARQHGAEFVVVAYVPRSLLRELSYMEGITRIEAFPRPSNQSPEPSSQIVGPTLNFNT